MNQLQTNVLEQQSPFDLYINTKSIKVGLFKLTYVLNNEFVDPTVDINVNIEFLTKNGDGYQHTGILNLSESIFDGCDPREFVRICVRDVFDVLGFGTPPDDLKVFSDISGLDVTFTKFTIEKSSESEQQYEDEIATFVFGEGDDWLFLTSMEYGGD